jgi:hypothetical protein
MRILIGTFAAITAIIASPNMGAQSIKDPPWNPDHIDHLPVEVRNAGLAMCPQTPTAGHYFAAYFHDQINLQFEHFHCEKARGSFCIGSQCL